jgi:restriction endonuclease S subunit
VKIEFSELIVHNITKDEFEINENGEVVLTKTKDQFDDIGEKFICKASMKDITENKTKGKCLYSLNMKDYKEYKVNCPDGYELKKLGDVCKINGYKISTENINGKFNFYTCSEKISHCNDPKIEGEHIILGSRGTIEKAIHLTDKQFGCGNNMLLINSINNNTNINKYIYFLLKNKMEYIKNKTTGSVVPMLSQSQLLSIEIPFPKDINKLKPQLDKLYKLHQDIMFQTEAIPEKEKAICEIIKKETEEGKKGVDYEEYKLGDVCNFQSGKYYTKDMTNTGEYPFYNASLNNPIGTHNNYCFDDKKYIIIFIGGNTNADTIGNVCICKGKIASTKPTVMIYNYNKSTYEYLYYYMKIIHQNIKKMAITTTGLGWLNLEKLNIINIKVLTENKMKKLKLQELFDEVDELKETLEKNKQTYQDKMKELFKDFEDVESSDKSNDSNDLSKSNSESESEEELKPKKKIKSKKQESSSESSSSESEEELKPKKKVKSKKQELSSESSPSESEEELKPKKKIKSKKQESSSESKSNSSESEEEIKPKNKVKSKTIKIESESEEEVKPKKKNK